MRTANRVKPKTDFGIEVRLFTAQTGMTVKEPELCPRLLPAVRPLPCGHGDGPPHSTDD